MKCDFVRALWKAAQKTYHFVCTTYTINVRAHRRSTSAGHLLKTSFIIHKYPVQKSFTRLFICLFLGSLRFRLKRPECNEDINILYLSGPDYTKDVANLR